MCGLFKRKKSRKENPEEVVVRLVPSGEPVPYSDVLGFFKFRNTLYYRSKGKAGKVLNDEEMSFTESIKATYPEEFADIAAKDIAKVLVQPYVILQ